MVTQAMSEAVVSDDVSDALTLVKIVNERMNGHERTCTERYERIQKDTSEIKAILSDFIKEAREATQRIHARIDEESSKARHALNNAVQIQQGELRAAAAEGRSNANLALTAAHDAKDGVKDAKIWSLTGLVLAAGAAITWLLSRLFGAH